MRSVNSGSLMTTCFAYSRAQLLGASDILNSNLPPKVDHKEATKSERRGHKVRKERLPRVEQIYFQNGGRSEVF